MDVHAYAAKSKGAKLAPFTYTTDELKPHDVLVKITHCGICHSDIHLIDDDWGVTEYPLVPGHEIIGLVEGRGSDVMHLREGDRVGVSWTKGTCMECVACIAGIHAECTKAVETCVKHHGGFSTYVTSDSRLTYKIPEALSSEQTAPLLCGGSTVFNPIRRFARPDTTAAVVGIGGLGHLALQFLSKFGCRVVALSHTPDKKEDSKRFGATEFSITKEGNLDQYARFFDFILYTPHVAFDARMYLSLLKPNGVLAVVGAAPSIVTDASSVIFGTKSITGGSVESGQNITDMLAFSARHHVQAQTERFALDECNRAIEKVRSNTIRYRAVLGIA